MDIRPSPSIASTRGQPEERTDVRGPLTADHPAHEPEDRPGLTLVTPFPAMEQPTRRISNVAMVVAGFVVGAIVIGIIHLAQPTSTPASPPSASTAAQPPPAVTAAETATAKAKLCSTFQHADAAIGGTINAPDGAEPGAAKANARAAVVSSAVALTRAVGPVTPPDIAKPANDLTDAYLPYALTAFAQAKSDPSPIVNATTALRQACG